MNLRQRSSAAPIRIGIYYLAWLVAAAMLSLQLIGFEPFIERASENKPYSYLFSKRWYDKLSDNKGNPLKVICLGDSNYFPAYDGMSKLLDEEISKRAEFQNLIVSQWAFVAADMFDYYCLFYEAERYSPDLIVIPINWRTFGSSWLSEKSYFNPELSALAPLRGGVLSEHENPVRSRGISLTKQIEYKFSIYSLYPMGIKMWVLDNLRAHLRPQPQAAVLPKVAGEENASIETPSESIEDGQPDAEEQPPSDLRSTFEANFPMGVTNSNPMMKDLRALASVASKHGTKVLFFVWPLDLESFADVGILDKPALEHSMQMVMKATEKENVYFVDLSNLLEHRYFKDKWGHCKAAGQRRIAAALAPTVIAILKESSAPSH